MQENMEMLLLCLILRNVVVKNMIEATESIKKIVKEAQDNYFPSNLKISMANDQSSRTINQVDDLVNNIILGCYL